VPSGIRAWDSSYEVTEIIRIILLLYLYKFVWAVHNQQTVTAGFLSPCMQYWRWFLFQGDNSGQVFPGSVSTILLISNTRSHKNIVLYPVCSCKLRHLVCKKNIKEIYEIIRLQFVLMSGWSFWRAFPVNRIVYSVTKSYFPLLEIKLPFLFLNLNAGCSPADCRHRPLTDDTILPVIRLTNRNFWI